MKIKPAFYGRPLVPMGFMWSLSLGKGATVICWSAYAQPKRLKTGLEPSKRMWLAKIVGSQPGCDIIVVRGRTPNEALRKLEKATILMVRDFVRIFAGVFRQVGSELLRIAHSQDFHKSKKK